MGIITLTNKQLNRKKNDMNQKINELIKEAAELIKPYSEDCYYAFLSQPFNRVNIALAFEAGFDEPNYKTNLILGAAKLERQFRSINK